MKKNKLMTVLMAATVAAGLLTGCGSNAADTTADATATDTAADEATDATTDAATDETADAATDTNADLSGSIAMAGSTSMEKLANAVAEAFMEKYPGVSVTAEFTGSSAGIESLEGGSVDIGNSSRSLKDEEKAAGCVENIVAIDGIAVVLDPANTVTDLTQDQLVQIYKGEVTNWKDLGGSDEPIVVVGREAGSGTRGAFVELFGIQEEQDGEKVDMTTDEASVTNSTSVMMTTVAGDENAIGYISLGSLDDTVKAVKIDGVEATVDNVSNDSYKIARPFNILTSDKESDAAKDFVNYIMSSDGQKIVEDNGYIKEAADAKAYEAADGVSGKVVVAGSSSVTPVMEKLAEGYEAVNKDVTVEVQQSDSTTGVNMAAEGTADIGMASRDLKDEEKDLGLTATVIARDGIAVIVNKDNDVDELTSDQVKAVYTGETTTWEDLAK